MEMYLDALMSRVPEKQIEAARMLLDQLHELEYQKKEAERKAPRIQVVLSVDGFSTKTYQLTPFDAVKLEQSLSWMERRPR